jgi:hypothetical protein
MRRRAETLGFFALDSEQVARPAVNSGSRP